MKHVLSILSIVLFITACSGDAAKNLGVSSDELKNMKFSDFDGQVTLEIMSGKLKGTHEFNKRHPEKSNRLFSIGMKKGPGYKEEVTKSGSFYIGTTDAEQSDYYLISLSKNFKGMIKEGSYPAEKESATLVIENKGANPQWVRAYGKNITNNNITFTKVGDWLPIKRNNEVRYVEGTYTDQIEFTFNDYNESVAKETVEMKVTFSLTESYRPDSSDKARK